MRALFRWSGSALLLVACDGVRPSVELDDGAAGVPDAGLDPGLEEPEAPRFATATGASSSLGWTSPSECPLSSDAAHCPICWSWTDGGPRSLGRNAAGDTFGGGLAAGDFNGDGYPDLAVGAPGETVDGVSDAGMIYVYLGTTRGFQPWRRIQQATPQADARLGLSLFAFDFDGDGREEILTVAHSGYAATSPVLRFEFDVVLGDFVLLQSIPVEAVDEEGPSHALGDEGLGASFTVGDFFDDGAMHLAVGAPGYVDPDAGESTGAVFVLRNTAGDLGPDTRIIEGGSSEQRCGYALDTWLVTSGDADQIVFGCPGIERVFRFRLTTKTEGYVSSDGLKGFGYSLVTTDLDDDGTVDILVGGDDPDFLALEDAATGSKVWADGDLLPEEPLRLRVLGVADFDQSLERDVLTVVDDGSGNHRAMIRYGDGSLSPSGAVSTFSLEGELAYQSRLAERGIIEDLDGDGELDVVLSQPGFASDTGAVAEFTNRDGASPSIYWASSPSPDVFVDQETELSSTCDECVVFDRGDGDTCGDETGAEICVSQACVTRGCGDGYRELGTETYTMPPAQRESCDDGGTLDGDACSSSCDTALFVVASEDHVGFAPSQGGVSLAEDGGGRLLFVAARDEGESRTLRVRLTSGAGAALPSPAPSGVTAELATFPLGWDAQANVAGLPAGGWAVVWTDPEVDGAGSGIGLRVVEPDGTFGPVVYANEHAEGDQYEPRVVALTDSVVVVWTDASGRDGPLGERRIEGRSFDLSLRPLGAETALSEPSGRASQPALAAFGDQWLLAYTGEPDAAFALPQVYAQRFGAMADAAPLQVSVGAGADPSLAAMPDGDFVVAWVSRDPAADHRGDVYAAELLEDMAGGLARGPVQSIAIEGAEAEVGPAVAAFDDTSFVVAYEDGGARAGLAYLSTLASLPPEAASLNPHLLARRQGDVSLLRTARGLWFAFSTDLRGSALGAPAAPRSFVAYLVPPS